MIATVSSPSIAKRLIQNFKTEMTSAKTWGLATAEEVGKYATVKAAGYFTQSKLALEKGVMTKEAEFKATSEKFFGAGSE